MGRRDHQPDPEPRPRVAVAARRRCDERRLGHLRARPRREGDAADGHAAVRAAGRSARPCRRDAVRPRAVADDPRGPARPEAAPRSGRGAARDGVGRLERRSRAMKALCYYGKEDVRVERVPDPEILNPRDAIVKVTTTAICGSDLHIYDGYIPA